MIGLAEPEAEDRRREIGDGAAFFNIEAEKPDDEDEEADGDFEN